GDDLARLAHLEVTRAIPRIDRCTARTERRAERIGQRLEHLEEALLEGTTAGDDDLGVAEVRALGLNRLESHVLDAGASVAARGDALRGLNGRFTAAGFVRLDLALAHRNDLLGRLERRVADGVPGE